MRVLFLSSAPRLHPKIVFSWVLGLHPLGTILLTEVDRHDFNRIGKEIAEQELAISDETFWRGYYNAVSDGW
jgi:hypothetical protein